MCPRQKCLEQQPKPISRTWFELNDIKQIVKVRLWASHLHGSLNCKLLWCFGWCFYWPPFEFVHWNIKGLFPPLQPGGDVVEERLGQGDLISSSKCSQVSIRCFENWREAAPNWIFLHDHNHKKYTPMINSRGLIYLGKISYHYRM